MLRGEWNVIENGPRGPDTYLAPGPASVKDSPVLKLFSEQVANNNSREKKNKTLLGAQLFGFVEMMPQLK